MRKPAVDYRKFRLRRLAEPQFSHLWLLLGWAGFLTAFFLTEKLIPAESCTPVHIPLDDAIPFCEWFLIPYVFWYALIVISLGYFLLYNVDGFRRLQSYLMIVQAVAIICYILWPTRQDLRPEVFARDNLLSRGVALLYAIDTNTGVCPSVHVAVSLGIASVWTKEKGAHPLWRAFVVFAVVMICLSTVFLKQHSALDVFAALPVCLAAELVVYRDRYGLCKKKKYRIG